ncbi:MAG: Uncharacterised protein [Candidatus Poseidoniaceae archaeon]|nr:MAG: Uncharacterised protein [Candidatus Poseidoniaceae archaeon]
MVTSKTRSMQAMVYAMRTLFVWSLKKQVNESWICFPSVLNLSETRMERSNWRKKVDILQDASCMRKTQREERLNEHLLPLHKNTSGSQCAQTRLQSTLSSDNTNHQARAFVVFGHLIRTRIKSSPSLGMPSFLRLEGLGSFGRRPQIHLCQQATESPWPIERGLQ